jgi:hypothetical protein
MTEKIGEHSVDSFNILGKLSAKVALRMVRGSMEYRPSLQKATVKEMK